MSMFKGASNVSITAENVTFTGSQGDLEKIAMTSSNKDRFYPTVGKSRRSSPGDSQNNHGVFFRTGQGGRTVLPLLSDFFPTSRSPGLLST